MNSWITPTPDGVAEALADGIDSFHHGYDWELDYSRDGNVVTIDVTPQDTDTGMRLDGKAKHFRAVVVEGEQTPVVIAPEVLAAARALYRAYAHEGSESAEQAAHTRYQVAAALYALTPEQAAFMAGQDAGDVGHAPIVLLRVDVEQDADMRGDPHGAESRPHADGWYVLDGTGHVVFGGTGHITADEALRFAAALVSQSYAVKAAQAEQGGGDDA